METDKFYTLKELIGESKMHTHYSKKYRIFLHKDIHFLKNYLLSGIHFITRKQIQLMIYIKLLLMY